MPFKSTVLHSLLFGKMEYPKYHFQIHSHTNNIFELSSVEPVKAKEEMPPDDDTSSTTSFSSDTNEDDPSKQKLILSLSQIIIIHINYVLKLYSKMISKTICRPFKNSLNLILLL